MNIQNSAMKTSFRQLASVHGAVPLIPLVMCGLAVLTVCTSCRTSTSTPRWSEDRSGPGEYRRVTAYFSKVVDETLRLLERATLPAARNPRTAILKFADAVDRLEVDSLAARARAEAMRARGEAYFATWQEHLAVVKDERVRQLALQHRAELDLRFERLRTGVQHLRATFRPFLSDLKSLRDSLESEPTMAQVSAKGDSIAKVKLQGRQVQEALAAVMTELDAAVALVTPIESRDKRP
jgi:hypothetical protein